MQLGKYVFIIRPDGRIRHYRYQQWQRFLSGQQAIVGPHDNIAADTRFRQHQAHKEGSGSIVAFECHYSLDLSQCESVYQWDAQLDSEGYCMSSDRRLANGTSQFVRVLDGRLASFLENVLGAAPSSTALEGSAQGLLIEYINDLLTPSSVPEVASDNAVSFRRSPSDGRGSAILEQVELFGFEQPVNASQTMTEIAPTPSQKRCA